MGQRTVKTLQYICERCGHAWTARYPTKPPPRTCPKCKSPYWDRPRQRK